jgi:uncharacterized repeat protein (TIGR02543 family)
MVIAALALVLPGSCLKMFEDDSDQIAADPADEFLAAYGAVLNMNVDELSTVQESVVVNAWLAWNELDAGAKARLGAGGQILEALYERISTISFNDGNPLMLHYRFDTVDSGGMIKIKDETGRNHGTMQGDGYVSRLGDYFYYYTNNSGWLDIGKNAAGLVRNLKNDFTISALLWVDNSANLAGTGNVIAAFSTNGNDAGDLMFLSARSGGCQGISIKPETGVNVDIRGEDFGKGEWVHIAYTQTGKTGQDNGVLYINGTEAGKGTVTTVPAEFGLSSYNWIGKSVYSGEGLLKNTRIADFRVYGHALDAAEITSMADQRGAMPIKHTVTFDPGTDGTVNPQTMESAGFGQALGSVPEPAGPDGAIFDGWYTEPAGGTKFSGNTIVTGDITVYVRWGDPEDYWKISFDANCSGELENPASIAVLKEGGEIENGALPVLTGRDGYMFGGWWTDASGGSEIGAGTIPTEDMTVYAHWIDLSMVCQISFDANESGIGGSLGNPGPVSVVQGLTIGTVLPWEKGVTQNGRYAFDGWFDTSETSGGAEYTAASTAPSETTLTLYARWSSLDCVITFDTQSSGELEAPASVTVEKNTAIGTLPSISDREWYKFKGWFTQPSGGTAVTAASTFSTDTATIYAQWERIKFKVIAASSDTANMGNLADGSLSTRWTAARLHHFGHVDLQYYNDSGVYIADSDPAGARGFRPWVTIDMGEVVNDITGLGYLRRQAGSAAQAISGCEVYVSTEVPLKISNVALAIAAGKAQKVAETTAWSTAADNAAVWQNLTFSPVNARYIQFRAIRTSAAGNGVDSGDFNVGVGELRIYKDNQTSTATPFPTNTVAIATSTNRDRPADNAIRVIDGNNTSFWLSGPFRLGISNSTNTPTAAEIIALKNNQPKDYRFDTGHWVTLDLGEEAADITGFRYFRRNDNSFQGNISDLEIWASPNPIDPASTAEANSGMFFVKTVPHYNKDGTVNLPITILNNAANTTANWNKVDFGSPISARYLHIRILSHVYSYPGHTSDPGGQLGWLGYATAAEFDVIRGTP